MRTNDIPGLYEIARALTRMGMNARVDTVPLALPSLWPALAQMTLGQIVLVLEQNDDQISIYDASLPDKQTTATAHEFAAVFDGTVLTRPPLAGGAGDPPYRKRRRPHWFWGEFRNFRRQFIEVAAGSMVANLLAVAVAMFSLQVYDRVIPHQSQATLWVLALGAMLAVMLEAFLKIARSTLMDLTGRRIELAVQERLMERLLGMKGGPGRATPQPDLCRHARIWLCARVFHLVHHWHAGGFALPVHLLCPGRLDRGQSGLGSGGRVAVDGVAGPVLPEKDDGPDPRKPRAPRPVRRGCCMRRFTNMKPSRRNARRIASAASGAELSALSAVKNSDQRHMASMLDLLGAGHAAD